MMRAMRTRWLGLLLLVVSGCADNIAPCGDSACYGASNANFSQELACCTRGCALNNDNCGSGLRYVQTDGTLGDCVDALRDCQHVSPDLASPLGHDLAVPDQSVPGDLLMSTID
jgi:hypothetical protein